MRVNKLRRVVLGLFVLLALPITAGAVTETADVTVNATVNLYITMTTSGSVAVNVTPAAGGAQTTQSDTVTISTNSTTGYTLTLSDTDANTSLINGNASVNASSGTQVSPIVLINNSWGYRVDGLGGFGAGPGSATSNQSSNPLTFAGVPASGSPNTLRTTASAAVNQVTTVWYSAKIDTSKPNGPYSDSVTYTATTN